MKSRGLLFAAVSAVALLSGQSAVFAGATFSDPRSGCQSPNCQAMTMRGTIQKVPANFSGDFFVQRGECVRFEVTGTAPFFDPAMLVVGPSYTDGRVWIDDDSGSGLNPKVAINNAPVTGWYTLIVTEYRRSDRAKDFTLKYGRYPRNNRNCNAATNPQSMPLEAMEK